MIDVRTWVAALVSCVAIVVASLAPAGAVADIHPAQAIAGPSNSIVEVAGAAMAPDGTGGVVYRARSGGVVHVFAVPFDNGVWGAPEEVDGEDQFGASQLAIAAGEGGRLLVVWVQPRNVNSKGVTLYELESASHDPGSEKFGQAIMVDPNVGEPDTGDASHVEPRLAMAPSGEAYAVYRVVNDDCGAGEGSNPRESECPPGHANELLEVRVAKFEYMLWSALGAVNRAVQVPMRTPTPANAPAIGIDVEGQGVVAWQEPANSGQPGRVWARRLFGSVPGTVLQASPETIAGRPVAGDAEAPAVIVSRYGEAKVAYRIGGQPGSAVPVSQLFANRLPSTFDPHGGEFKGPVALPGAAAAGIGGVSGAIDESGNYRMAWDQGGAVRLLSGGELGAGAPVTLGSSSGPALETLNPAGGGTTFWPSSPSSSSSSPAVQAREDYANGAYQTAILSGDVPGPITGLSLGGSGQGDALAGWMQGPAGASEVVGDFVQAPPAPFLVSVPEGWVHGSKIPVEWEASTDAVGGVTYAVFVDQHRLLGGLTGTSAAIPSAQIGDGVHEVQVLASDSTGQATMSAKTKLRVAVDVPAVHVALIDHRRGVRVSVSDPTVGVAAGATRIAFGDGARAHARARVKHVYRRAGAYTIVAYVRAKGGNGATVHIRVRVA
jgi:hypothetical protein